MKCNKQVAYVLECTLSLPSNSVDIVFFSNISWSMLSAPEKDMSESPRLQLNDFPLMFESPRSLTEWQEDQIIQMDWEQFEHEMNL